jgi:hypothetical protein
MKASNKILIVTTGIIISFLVIYNLDLKAEFLKGKFKERFYSMKQLSFKDFSKVNFDAADRMSIRIERGNTYAVWVEKAFVDRLIFKQNGQTINIGDDQSKGLIWGGEHPYVVIICPSLDSLTTTAYNAGKDGYETSYGTSTTIAGFKQPKLGIQVNAYTTVNLADNIVDALNANVGDKEHGQAGLNVNASNQIRTANIQVPGKSELKLSYPKIDKLNYNFGDSSKVTITGGSLGLLKK